MRIKTQPVANATTSQPREESSATPDHGEVVVSRLLAVGGVELKHSFAEAVVESWGAKLQSLSTAMSFSGRQVSLLEIGFTNVGSRIADGDTPLSPRQREIRIACLLECIRSDLRS